MGTHFKENEEKITYALIIAGVIIVILLFGTFVGMVINPKNNEKVGQITNENKTNDTKDSELEKVSIDIGKKINEVEKELENNTDEKATSKTEDIKESSNTNKNVVKNTENKKENNIQNSTKQTASDIQTKEEKEIKFDMPCQKGQIIREFAKDSLVYSETLEEWITHTGIDIKLDKASVVKAAADGKVTAIKNDPRFGLTVIIEHANGFKTIYANLLTAEYVVEGEEVSIGQTIGTIGNSATFEIADDFHLHFEMLKDGENIDPKNYINL